jgi:hypothetical protein
VGSSRPEVPFGGQFGGHFCLRSVCSRTCVNESKKRASSRGEDEGIGVEQAFEMHVFLLFGQ